MSDIDIWDGQTIVPVQINGKSVTIVASHRRDIILTMGGIEFYFDTLTIMDKEKVDPIHGSSKARAYAMLGGDIDGTGKVSLASWIEDMQTANDLLRNKLFDIEHEGRALYFTMNVYYVGSTNPAADENEKIGGHQLLTLHKCKADSDGFNFPSSGAIKSEFSFQYADRTWFNNAHG